MIQEEQKVANLFLHDVQNGILQRSDSEILCTLYYCPTHEATLAAVDAMTEAATSQESEAAAWQYASSLWQEDVDALYEALLSKCNNAAKALVLKEQLLFSAQIANHEATLTLLYPDDPAYVAETIAKLYMDHCFEMCYALSTAPENRTDDLLRVPCEDSTTASAEDCSFTCTPIDAANFNGTVQFCDAHRMTCGITNALLTKDTSAEAWSKIETIWQTELTKSYKALKSNVGEDGYTVLNADITLYEQWKDANKAIQELLYPENAALAGQLSARIVADRVLEFCEK